MYPLSGVLLDAPLHSRNTTFPKPNVKYKQNLPRMVRVRSARHPNPEKSRRDAVLHLRHHGAWGGEDTLPSRGNVSEGKSAPVWALQAEALLAHVRQEEITSALEDTGCWEVKCTQPSSTDTSVILQNQISLLLVLYCLLWRSGQILTLDVPQE